MTHTTLEPETLTTTICGVASSALGVNVPADADLFQLGLDSLVAIELCAILEGELQMTCTLEDVFEHPVPCDLARVVWARTMSA